jgi:hypothetical protein
MWGDGQLTLADYETLGGSCSIEAAVEQAFEAADNDPAIPKARHGLRCSVAA